MAIFTEVVNLWKSNDLLSQAWDESYNMIRLSNKIFGKAVFFLRNGGKKSEIKALKKRDQEINNFQKNVRKSNNTLCCFQRHEPFTQWVSSFKYCS